MCSPAAAPAGGVYTIHVQSTGLRFATGGADAQVKVWSMLPVVDVQQEKAGPLVLATLSDHTSTVNTVRFSKNGKYLASGARRAWAGGWVGGWGGGRRQLVRSAPRGTGPGWLAGTGGIEGAPGA